ncbi:hypothetical protein JCM19275_656 [Nonlabens ulvanivorans]|uniref:Uncharacterized protein n=1 Tax=Nonlabens ulvanivorans TaxID=906888 RepID=A0A090WGR8_NONUL|nr:hypothetical protein [Nonlabens ulvanivorans]GAL76250.1 hypothetical protein JCM19275_656 [Nonlabens ulvanivorans]
MIKYCYTALLITVLLVFNSCKENVENLKESNYIVTGDVIDYDGDVAQVNIMGFFVDPLFKGSVDENGTLEIELPNEFNETSQKAFDDYNSLGDAAYELSAIGIEDVFSPLENLMISNPNAQIALAGKYYGFETYQDGIRTGRIFPGSSREFITYNINPEKHEPIEGHFYMWLYSDSDTSIKGSNGSPTEVDESGNVIKKSIRNYDVTLSKGWNVVRYAVMELGTDSEGDLQVMKSAFNTEGNYEKEIDWYYFPL